jgi:hypothetical protein
MPTTDKVDPTDDHFKKVKDVKKIKDPAKMSDEEKKFLEEQLTKEVEKYGLPKGYLRMTIRFKTFWLWFNIIAIVASAALAITTYMILDSNPEDCSGIRIVTWCLFVLHITTFVFSSMALCGLEKRLCSTPIFIVFVMFNVVILIWTQTTYFSSQKIGCNYHHPELYFWLMFEIMVFYILTAFIVCYFFRRFCQDPKLKLEDKAEEAATTQLLNEGAVADKKPVDPENAPVEGKPLVQ